MTELEEDKNSIQYTKQNIPEQIQELPNETEEYNPKLEESQKNKSQTARPISLRSVQYDLPKDVVSERISENLSQRSVSNCLICFEKMPDCVIMECGHGGLCYDCGLEIWKSTGLCFLCREKIEQLFQIDIANPSKNGIRVLAATKMISLE